MVTTYYKFGNELSAHEGEYKITFNGTWDKQANPKKGEFDESTGWGMSVDGYLKPDEQHQEEISYHLIMMEDMVWIVEQVWLHLTLQVL